MNRLMGALIGAMLAGSVMAAPAKIILDTDMGPDYDDVGAMAVLNALADRGEAEPLAVVSCNRTPLAVACIELLNAYYGRWTVPVGCVGSAGQTQNDGRKIKWQEVITAKYPWFRHRASIDAPDAVAVMRRALADSPDGSVTVVSVGFFTNLRLLLQSGPDAISPLGGKALVQKKAKQLVSMAGGFPGGREWNVFNDAASAKYTAENWPTPILFSGFEIGNRILTGKRLIASPVADSPVKDVFETVIVRNGEDRDGRMSWDETAVLAAIRGAEPYFGIERGTIHIDGNGANTWTPSANGPHARLVKKMEWADVGKAIEDLMMAAPKCGANKFRAAVVISSAR